MSFELSQIAPQMALCALAAGSMTEVLRRGLSGWLKSKGAKPWWRASALRAVAVLCGAGAGLFMFADDPRLGLLIGVASANVTTEAVGSLRRFIRAKAAAAESGDF